MTQQPDFNKAMQTEPLQCPECNSYTTTTCLTTPSWWICGNCLHEWQEEDDLETCFGEGEVQLVEPILTPQLPLPDDWTPITQRERQQFQDWRRVRREKGIEMPQLPLPDDWKPITQREQMTEEPDDQDVEDFNSHKFYFGDLAVTPEGETGEVVGIWLRDLETGEGWVYRLKGIAQFESSWWREGQLLRPSEARPLAPFDSGETDRDG